MASHSGILAWRIPRTEEPGMLHTVHAVTESDTATKLGGSDGKESACNAGDPGLSPGSERSPGEGNGYPLWYSCLENFMDSGA